MQADTHSLLAVAAELRAAGQTWEAVALRVGRQSSTCRKWPSRYPDEWDALMRQGGQAAVGPARESVHSGSSGRRIALGQAASRVRRSANPVAERAGNVADSLHESVRPLPRALPHQVSHDLPTERVNTNSARLALAAIRYTCPPVLYGFVVGSAFLVGRMCGGNSTNDPNPPAAHAAQLPLVYRHDGPLPGDGAEIPGHRPTAAPLTSRAEPPEIVRDAAASREPPPAPRRTGTRRPVPDPDLDRLSDEDLLSRFRRGQREVFGTLVRRYQRELYGYLRRYLGDPHLADDVFQTTFVQVFSKAAQYEPGRPVRPWLYAIATNQAIDAMRRAGRHPAVSLEQTETESEGERRGLIDLLEARESDPFDNVDAAETRELVRACIARLPDFLRQVLLMAYYQGLKYQEIADALDIPLGTVKSRLHAALVKLHEAWDEAAPRPQSPVPSRDD